MIGYISGKIKDRLGDELIVLTGSGVGYRVHAGAAALSSEAEIELFVHTAMRENELSLWGFTSLKELQLFEKLLDVSGVGVRTAFTMVSALGVDTIVTAVTQADLGMLKAPGVGRKTAERIVLELKDKLDSMGGVVGSSGSVKHSFTASQLFQDAAAALESLGYRRSQIDDVAKDLKPEDMQDSQTLVKSLLMRLS